MKKFSLARPYIKQEEINAVVKVLKSGHLSLGPVYQEFEKAYLAKKIHPLDLKNAVSAALIRILKKPREYFQKHRKELEQFNDARFTN